LQRGNQEEIGALMDKNQEYLRKLGVSSSELETLIKAAKKADAYGAKLTGAGGGGCMIALTDHPRDVITALKEKGATAFKVKTNQEGVKIEG
jgi:mevalonate kinase